MSVVRGRIVFLCQHYGESLTTNVPWIFISEDLVLSEAVGSSFANTLGETWQQRLPAFTSREICPCCQCNYNLPLPTPQKQPDKKLLLEILLSESVSSFPANTLGKTWQQILNVYLFVVRGSVISPCQHLGRNLPPGASSTSNISRDLETRQFWLPFSNDRPYEDSNW